MKLIKFFALLMILPIVLSFVSCGGTKVITSEIYYDENDNNTVSTSNQSSTEDSTTSKNTSSNVSSDPSSKVNDTSTSKRPAKPSETPNSSEDDYFVEELKTYKITEHASDVYLGGKATMDVPGCRFWGVADSLCFTANCSGSIDISYQTIGLPTAQGYGMYLTVYIDGVRRSTRHHINFDSGTLTIADGLMKGKHTVEIYCQTEYSYVCNGVFLTDIAFDGEFEKYTPKPLTIEFIGDSITAGYGSYALQVSAGPEDGNAPCYQDGTLTYAFLTCKALNANIITTAQSGIGIVKGFREHTMPQIYKQFPFIDSDTAFEYKTKPDIVVVNLGTNDCWNGVSQDKFIEGAISFGKELRRIHPSAKIVFIGGMMTTGYNEVYAKIASSLGGSTRKYYSFTTENCYSNHPYADEHKVLANEFTAFLKTIL